MFTKLTNWSPEPEVVRSSRTGDIYISGIQKDNPIMYAWNLSLLPDVS
jgi:hypothetical protein